jgi:hypothetical protein
MYYLSIDIMTCNETIKDMAIVAEPKVEGTKHVVDVLPDSIYSKPFDITARDNAKIEADKVAAEAKRVEMENIESSKIDANATFQ